MTTHDDIRRICSALPATSEGEGRFGFGVQHGKKVKGFCWTWLERVDPKKGRVPNDAVLAVATPGLLVKEMILQSDPKKFFTEDHYNGYPAVLVRLAEIDPDELEPMLIEAWRCKAPPALLKAYDAEHPSLTRDI